MHKRPAHLCINSVTFVEKPASPDEIAIADVIKKYHRAAVVKDIATILTLFHPDVEIKILRNGRSIKPSKEFFAPYYENLKTVSFENILIRVNGPSDAFAWHNSILRYSGDVVEQKPRIWTFKKTSGVWRIATIEVDI